MPPICTPEKLSDAYLNCSENSKQPPVEYVTPPLGTNNYIHKKTGIKYIQKIQEACPAVCNIFNIEEKIGEGTFSTVFLASLKDNRKDKSFAIKHLVPTTHPKRIEVELHCLKQIGGEDNVAGLQLCLREQDNVVFVMPYLQHDHFGDYVKDMSAEEVALYIKNLIKALCRVHSFGIIHRDVKPNNFLYDRKNKKFLLIDFGLAQVCSSTQPSNVQKRKRESLEQDVESRASVEPPAKRQALHSRNLNTLSSVITHLQKYEGKRSSCKENCVESVTEDPVFKSPLKVTPTPALPVKKSPFKFPGLDLPPTHSHMMDKKNHQRNLFQDQPTPKANPASSLESRREKHYCKCFGKPKICTICMVKKGQEACRAGTPGFRPPEVLLKYDRQTTAVDMWAVGVIMLSQLSAAYPFFQAPDDLTALAEIITVFGSDRICRLSRLLGRELICSERRSGFDLRKVCYQLRRRGGADASATANTTDYVDDAFPSSAYDLLERLLDVNPSTRITAAQALRHPFLSNV